MFKRRLSIASATPKKVCFALAMLFSVTAQAAANDVQTLQSRLLTHLCGNTATSAQRSAAEAAYQRYSSYQYSESDLAKSAGIKDAQAALPIFACDAVKDNNTDSADKAKVITSKWASLGRTTYYPDEMVIRNYTALFSGYLQQHYPQQASAVIQHLRKQLMYNALLEDPGNSILTPYSTDNMRWQNKAVLIYMTFGNTAELANFKTYLDRFMQPSIAGRDGFKPDGTGFHHNMHYNEYMVIYNDLIEILGLLQQTNVQINQSSYLTFRRAVYAMTQMQKGGMDIPSIGGRGPFGNRMYLTKNSIRLLMEVGGEILAAQAVAGPEGKQIDPFLASVYYKVAGDERYASYYKPEMYQGFAQFNYGSLGVYQGEGWLTGLHGFSRANQGTQIFYGAQTQNTYGRYQDYGTIEVMYDTREQSGFPWAAYTAGWDWNKWPGTTSILLPWDKLLPHSASGSERAPETNQRKFAGALQSADKQQGIFAMDFQEGAWKNHNATFTFRKSVFAFNNMMVALGSGISNNDTEHPTITTLFQNALYTVAAGGVLHSTASGKPITLDAALNAGQSVATLPYQNIVNDMGHKWVIDAVGTGFLVQSNSKVNLTRSQQTTPHGSNRTASTDDATAIAYKRQPYYSGDYATAWIDHGKSPNGAKYHYAVVPKATTARMDSLKANPGYQVLQQDTAAHIVKIGADQFGYALFEAGKIAHGPITNSDTPVLVMSKQQGGKLTLSISNPDLGYVFNCCNFSPVPPKRVELTLRGNWTSRSRGVSSNVQEGLGGVFTTISFNTEHGLPQHIQLMGSVSRWGGFNPFVK